MTTIFETVLPRILTQACRDTTSPAHGCFDRNWWHYKIRDFPSIILQQGGYTVLRASEVCDPALLSPEYARTLAAASCRFWNTRACKHGSFEEYYPWEQGYPPVAFSTLAVAKLVSEGIIPEADIHKGLARAAKQLTKRFEPKAANQQIAGLAALAWIKKISPSLVTDTAFDKQKQKSLALQTDEGWYWEYDGPDIGYLSVTLDCLWDLIDATHDTDFRHAADRALQFIYNVVALPGCGLGMLNARNTDYVVPYGLARYLTDGTPEQAAQAGTLLDILYHNTDSPTHFLKAIDDRYWCHYIGHSVARAIAILRYGQALCLPHSSPQQSSASFQLVQPPSPEPKSTLSPLSPKLQSSAPLPPNPYVACDATPKAPPGRTPKAPRAAPLSRATARRTPTILNVTLQHSGCVLTLALNKGGCVRLTKDGKSAFDFGWIIDTGKKQYVSHWWSLDWQHSSPQSPAQPRSQALTPKAPRAAPLTPIPTPLAWRISGSLVPHKEATSTPFMHIALRILSFIFGKSLVGILKNVMIFKKAKSPYTFTRTIEETEHGIIIHDTITGLTGSETITPAPRASKRHVASADSYHTEDFDLQTTFTIDRSSKKEGDTFTCTTLIHPARA